MEELRDLERELGMELDPDFRDFLVAHNDAEIVGDAVDWFPANT